MKGQFVNRRKVNLNEIELTKNHAWVTFLHDSWEQNWWAVLDKNGDHLEWSEDLIMAICRERFGNVGLKFGIAETEQMLFGNAVRDNL